MEQLLAVFVDRNRSVHLRFKEDRDGLHFIRLGTPIDTVRFKPKDATHLQPVLYHGQPYPPGRAAQTMAAAAAQLGLTVRAAVALGHLLEQPIEAVHRYRAMRAGAPAPQSADTAPPPEASPPVAETRPVPQADRVAEAGRGAQDPKHPRKRAAKRRAEKAAAA